MTETCESDAEWERPYLLGFDPQGRLVWMSEHAKSELGEMENVTTTLGARLRAGVGFRVWPVLSLPDALVIGAQAEPLMKAGSVRLEDKMIGYHLRLERAERVLSARVKGLPAGRGKLIRQIELERQRLGRELHTSVGQMLAAIRLQLEVIAVQAPNPGEAVQRALDAIGRLAGDALEQVRGISRRLHPPEWQRLTLEMALGQLWEISGIPQTFEASLNLPALSHEPAQEIKVLIYRAAQEALANIARHSKASRVEMTLTADNETITLSVTDDGHGFDPSTTSAAPANMEFGIGLRSLREEAADLGARLEVVSGPRGTTLKVSARFAPRG